MPQTVISSILPNADDTIRKHVRIYYRHRCLSAQLGRFLSRDPIGYAGGINLRLASFVPSGVDPSGLVCCCCCVEDLKIINLHAFNGYNPILLRFGRRARQLGHVFDVVVELKYKYHFSYHLFGDGEVSDCSLSWKERTNMPMYPGMVGHRWIEVPPRNNQTLKPFSQREKPCPGEETIVLPEAPGLGISRNRTAKRYLFIVVTVRSCSRCHCAKQSQSVFAAQYLELDRGNPSRQDFYIGSPAILMTNPYP